MTPVISVGSLLELLGDARLINLDFLPEEIGPVLARLGLTLESPVCAEEAE